MAAVGAGMPPGSERTRLAVPCSSVIQKITQSTLSWRMICLVKMVLSAKKTAATRAAAWPGPKGDGAGLGDDEDAEKADERPGEAGARQRLAEEEGREQRHPDRVGELERDELAERDQPSPRRTRGSARYSGRGCA